MPSVETEVVAIPPLAPGEASLIDLHSLLNMLNVLCGELGILGLTLADDDELLGGSVARCISIARDLSNADAAHRHVAALQEHGAAILGEVARVCAAHPGPAATPAAVESAANIRSIFDVLEVRARELLARAQAPGEWVAVPIADLRMDFRQVFAAIEKNSHGRYRIIYNLARQEPADYYVDFAVESANGQTIALPLVFKDVMRDLMANARKYTPPGGTISAGLFEAERLLKFSVQDSGCGIPPDEIETVVHYGRRGSNVLGVRTMGGGFGLTKAFLVTKQFGGRFWIRSELGVGTRIRLEIPRPGS